MFLGGLGDGDDGGGGDPGKKANEEQEGHRPADGRHGVELVFLALQDHHAEKDETAEVGEADFEAFGEGEVEFPGDEIDRGRVGHHRAEDDEEDHEALDELDLIGDDDAGGNPEEKCQEENDVFQFHVRV